MKVARLKNDGYNLITSVGSQTQITIDAASQAADYYAGAKVITRTENWYSETRTITASSSQTITINSAPSGNFDVGEGVILLNKLEYLDAPGEWFYNSATDTVYLWTPAGDSPANYEVRGSTINNGINVLTNNYVTIKNIEILQQKDRGISLSGGGAGTNNISITNCTLSGQDNFGIWSENFGLNNNFSNNSFSDINGKAIYAYHVGSSVVENNLFKNIGLFDNWGIGNNDGTAVEFSTGDASGLNSIIHNTIENCGYNGIMWRGQTNIEHSFIKNACVAKSDGGAIYTGSPSADGSLVKYNIIENVVGTMAGGITSRNLGEGIYLDENSVGITVEYNTISGCSNSGIFLHKPNNHIVRYNKIMGARYGFFCSNTPTGTSLFTNNMVITGSGTDDYEPRQLAVRKATTGVSINNNIYVNGFTSDIVFRTTDGSYTDFAAWKAATGDDANSIYVGTDLGAGETQRLVANTKKTVRTFFVPAGTVAKDLGGNSVTGSFMLGDTSKYIRGTNINYILDYVDAVAPVITAFQISATSAGNVVNISSFTATDNRLVAGYKITQSATAPLFNDAGWTTTAPATYTASGTGPVTLYALVKDAAGNISASISDTVDILVSFDLLDNVVSWHEGNNASGTTITDSKGGSSGTLYAGATIDQTGSIGKAILFDGTDDYMYIPRNNSIFAAGMPLDFSVLLRFKVLTIDASNRRIFESSYGTTDFFNITNNTSNVVVTMAKNNVRKSFNTTSALNTSTWYVIVATWNATTETFKVYLNGTLITNSTANIGVNGSSTSMAIARRLLEPMYTNILFETLVIFDKVLTADEIDWLQDKEFSDL